MFFALVLHKIIATINVEMMTVFVSSYRPGAWVIGCLLVPNRQCKLLSKLEDISAIDPQVGFNLLWLCSGFCRMVHLARSTPSSVAADSLKILDCAVRSCFLKCLSVDLSEVAWSQSQLSLTFWEPWPSLSLTTQVLLLLHLCVHLTLPLHITII